ncbi:hypothetical protein PG984_012181 [Apiospora sp. TS-2023a]
MSSSSPTDDRRRSAPSLFTRLGFFKRQPKHKQVDYRDRWPTVTTLVEQRSDSCFFNRDPTMKPLSKPAKVKALETASVPLRWLHHRLESVQDHLDHSIEVAEAKALKRATSMSERPTKPMKPGESKHPYDTGVEARTRESVVDEDHRATTDSTATTGTLLRFETNITAKPSPPLPPQNKWRLPFTGGAAKSPRPSSEHSNADIEEEDVTAGMVSQFQWKSAKTRRPSKFPDRKASFAFSTSSRRTSYGGGRKLEKVVTPHSTTNNSTPKHTPESSQQHKKQQSSHHPRRESVVSTASRRSSPRTITPSQPTEPATALSPPPQQTGNRFSGQFAQAVALLSPQSRSRTTSANRGMEHAQQQQQQQPSSQTQAQQKRGGRKLSNTSRSRSRTPGGSNSATARTTPQDQLEDPLGATRTIAASSTSPPEMSPRSFKSPKSGAFRHLLNVVKGGVPPSRAMSPLSMNGD